VTRRRGRRRKKLLDDLKDRRGYSHLKEEALDSTMWRNCFGRGVGPVVRQITELMNVKRNVPKTSKSGGRRVVRRRKRRSRKIINRNVKLTAYDLTRKLCCVVLVFQIYY
jgi:hypothetical protein